MNVKRKKRITCCGDSITFGMLASSAEMSYPSVLQKLLGDNFEVGNYGRNGATAIADYEFLEDCNSPYLKSPEYAAAMLSEPDIVVLMLGMNDGNPTMHFNAKTGGEISEEELYKYKESLEFLIESFEKLPTKPRVYLAMTTAMKRVVCENFDENYIKYFTKNLIKIRNIQREVAEECHVTLIETLENMDAPEFYRDGMHMTDAGYRQLASVIKKKLQI